MSINQTVTVDAFYFVNRKDGLKTFPRQITWSGHTITFASGLSYLVGQGTQIFDMLANNERETYRLRRDGNSWTLLATKGVYA